MSPYASIQPPTTWETAKRFAFNRMEPLLKKLPPKATMISVLGLGALTYISPFYGLPLCVITWKLHKTGKTQVVTNAATHVATTASEYWKKASLEHCISKQTALISEESAKRLLLEQEAQLPYLEETIMRASCVINKTGSTWTDEFEKTVETFLNEQIALLQKEREAQSIAATKQYLLSPDFPRNDYDTLMRVLQSIAPAINQDVDFFNQLTLKYPIGKRPEIISLLSSFIDSALIKINSYENGLPFISKEMEHL